MNNELKIKVAIELLKANQTAMALTVLELPDDNKPVEFSIGGIPVSKFRSFCPVPHRPWYNCLHCGA